MPKLIAGAQGSWRGLLGSLVIGFGIALSVANHFFHLTSNPWTWYFNLFPFLALALSALVHWVLLGFALPRLAGLSSREHLFLAIASCVWGAVLIAVVPIRVPLPPTAHSLEIRALGAKSPVSGGTDVTIVSIMRAGRFKAADSEIRKDGVWPMQGDSYVFRGTEPSSLKWEGISNETLHVIYESSPSSGFMTLRWDGREKKIDCYGEILKRKALRLPVTFSFRSGAATVIMALLLCVADICALGLVVFILITWLLTLTPLQSKKKRDSRWEWLLYAAPCAAAWTVCLLVFWPGIMNHDSIDQWRQMASGHLNNWHPAFHTMTIWLITRVWFSPAIVVMVQIAALSALVGWGLMRIRRLGAPVLAVWAVSLFYALSPVNDTLVVTLNKDVAYGIVFLWLSIIMMEVGVTGGAWLNRPGSWIVMGVIAALISLYRHNGPVTGLGTLAILLVLYAGRRRVAVASALALALAIWLGVLGPLYTAARVDRSFGALIASAPFIHHLAAHVDAGTRMSEREREYLEWIRPQEVPWPYSPYFGEMSFFDRGLNIDRVLVYRKAFLLFLASLAIRDPWVDVEHMIKASTPIWRITRDPTAPLYGVILPGQEEHGFELQNREEPCLRYRSMLPALQTYLERWGRWPPVEIDLSRYLYAAQRPDFSWLIFRPAIYLYLVFFAAFVALVRSRKKEYLIALAPIALNSIALALVIYSPDFRYQYGVYLASPLLSAFYLFCVGRGGAIEGNGEIS